MVIDPAPKYRTLVLKYDENYSGERKSFFMEHKTSTPSAVKPLGRTIYLTCVPPWMTVEGIKEIFAENGPIQEVFLESRPNPGPSSETECDSFSKYLFPLPEVRVGFGFKFAYIVFKTAQGMKNAMTKMDLSIPRIVSSRGHSIITGLVKWKQEYNESILIEADIDSLKAEIKEFTEDFDRQKESTIRQAEEDAEADEDGWITVSRHTSKKPVVGRSEKVQARIKAKVEKKRKRKELDNFYKFQMRDEKLRRLEELKTKFEADKEKQIKLKQDRKFKPF